MIQAGLIITAPVVMSPSLNLGAQFVCHIPSGNFPHPAAAATSLWLMMMMSVVAIKRREEDEQRKSRMEVGRKERGR